MEQNSQTQNFAKGIFLTKRKSKGGKDYLELSIKSQNGYDKYICFESKKTDKYGNQMFSVLVKDENALPKKEDATDLPF